MSGEARDRRAERLAAELRANLARRKAQARVRRDDEGRGSEAMDTGADSHEADNDT